MVVVMHLAHHSGGGRRSRGRRSSGGRGRGRSRRSSQGVLFGVLDDHLPHLLRVEGHGRRELSEVYLVPLQQVHDLDVLLLLQLHMLVGRR